MLDIMALVLHSRYDTSTVPVIDMTLGGGSLRTIRPGIQQFNILGNESFNSKYLSQ